jgi:hypothetical protein
MQRVLVFGLLVLPLLGAVPSAQSDGGTAASGPTPPTRGVLQAVITTSELVVGQNRFAFGLLKGNTLLEDAHVVVRLYALRDQQAHQQAELPVRYHKLEVVEQGHRVHVHPDGTRHVHGGDTDVRGIYVTQVSFDRPGPWGLEVLTKDDTGAVEASRFTVNVLEAPRTPVPGTPAPRSRNLIASDVKDLRQIDSSDPPDPRLHQVRIADAITQGRPQVIVFASPQLCVSRVCGPVVDMVRMLLPTYADRVVFSHQEIWQRAFPRKPFPTVQEWSLPSEPWIFFVDGKGLVRAKFEGLTTVSEIEAALKQVLDPSQ